MCDDGRVPQPAPWPESTWACTRDGTRDGGFITLYPDGSIAARGHYRDGLLDGPWQRLDPTTANVIEEGGYVAGQRHGVWRQLDPRGRELGRYELDHGSGIAKQWYANGTLYSETPLASGVRHGVVKTYDEDGKPLSSTRWALGNLDGPSQFGYPRDLRIEEMFRRGVRYGERKVYQQNQLIADERYDRAGRLDGPWTSLRSNKVKRVEGQYSSGKRVGHWVWRDREDRKEREGDYVWGRRDGDWLEWVEDKLVWSGHYNRGRPDGTFSSYAKTGALIGEYTMKDGNGWVLTYYPNGRTASRQQMYGGIENGTYQEIAPTGKTILEGHYVGGIKHGSWKQWDYDGAPVVEQRWNRGTLDGPVKKYAGGRLAMETTFVNGRATGKYVEYRLDGNPQVTGEFAEDRRTGMWTFYDASGSVVRTATYRNGQLDGPYRELTGRVVDEGTMVAGRRSGEWTRTDHAGNVRKLTYRTP